MGMIIRYISSHTIVLFALLIFLAIIFWLLKFEKELKINWPEAALISFLHIVIGWPSMKLLAIIEAGFNLHKAANMRLYGAILILLPFYYLWGKITKRNIPLVMDISAICVVFGAFAGRLNCLTKGCCKGILFFNQSYRWPLREIEILFYVVFVVYYFGKIGTSKTYGQVYPIYLIFYGVIRFLSEFVREEFTTKIGIFHIAHIWSLIAIALGLVMFYKVNIKRKSGANHRKSQKSNDFRRKNYEH